MSRGRNKGSWATGEVQVRSGLEEMVGNQLTEKGIPFEYESKSFPWLEKLSRAQCTLCGAKEAYVERSYTPDFFLPNGTIIEVKGNFTSKDRKIAAAMKEQYPELNIVLLFDKDNWLNKNRKNRYSDWCKSKGIGYSIREIPEEWLA